ncbi:MAG TPA: ThuA domain-containing protein [Tepidisphaeraceae bacterium]|nr:ThuA domain-containing protein [Tepidisphaeraceae bacterium]
MVDRARWSRRGVLKAAAGAALLGRSAWNFAAAVQQPKKILFFTKSAGFEHTVIRRPKEGGLSYAEQVLIDLGKPHGYEVTATKDGSVFTPERLASFDAAVFYTTGDLTTPGKDGQPPMPGDGPETLIKWIESGKGFLGIHSADDTFLTPVDANGNATGPVHPYIKMIGGEFNKHGKQQDARILAAEKAFGPIHDLHDFEMLEEWYKVKNLSPDLHVILVQDTRSMPGEEYKALKPYPQTWARTQQKGRIFYTTLGHREDTWKNPLFENIVLGALAWVTGQAEADVTPNLKQVVPEAAVYLRKD